MQGLGQVDIGFNSMNCGYNSQSFKGWRDMAEREQKQLSKALTTGSGAVTDSDTGGRTLRKQFLFGELEQTSFEQDDLKLQKIIPKKSADNVFLEWALMNDYGSGGDGFVSETGSDGAFGVDFQDDNYERQSERVKFLAEGRQVSEVSQQVDNLADPMATSRKGLTLALLAKANMASYFGDETTSSTQFNGIIAQLRAWMDRHPTDYGMFFDCGGRPIDKYILQEAAKQNRMRFGRGGLLLQSVQGKSDSTKLIWPENRNQEGQGGTFGGQFGIFDGPYGKIKLEDDLGLIPGRPLRIDGRGADGLPRTTSSLDSGSLTIASDPFAALAAQAAGGGYFWQNFTKNTDGAPLATTPDVPRGSSEMMGGNNSNQLAAGTYYYAVSVVYKGFESAAWVKGQGTQASNVLSGAPTGTAVTAGQIVKIDLDNATPAVTGLGSTYNKSLVKYRVYRAGGPGVPVPTRLSDFHFLCECGTPTAGNSRVFDNGMHIPGSDNAFLITTKRNNSDGWAMMNLLPLMQKMLPVLALGDQFCMLWFTTILLRMRRHHIWFRNVGQA